MIFTTKNTHRIIGSLVSIPMITSPVGLIGLIGCVAPDWDIKLGRQFHRTFTHSLLFLGFTTMFFNVINKEIGLIWFISYLSHLILDSCTESGVMFLYPFKKKSYGLKLCYTGGVIDMLIENIGYILLVIVVIYSMSNVINFKSV
ncbi:metal-dependent hydrolase [Clostridium sp. M14]|uniref:metal-dependent hydrolase n=1 Tax=Clostridium sp. M14 TaxID=2716311 RepID=UPI001CCF18D6|nr:metal-dependent hydrolase [Clostridium sp. M14]MBZ9693390.1 metal-dependent hydrolase [Clostridium sp. M14]